MTDILTYTEIHSLAQDVWFSQSLSCISLPAFVVCQYTPNGTVSSSTRTSSLTSQLYLRPQKVWTPLHLTRHPSLPQQDWIALPLDSTTSSGLSITIPARLDCSTSASLYSTATSNLYITTPQRMDHTRPRLIQSFTSTSTNATPSPSISASASRTTEVHSTIVSPSALPNQEFKTSLGQTLSTILPVDATLKTFDFHRDKAKYLKTRGKSLPHD